MNKFEEAVLEAENFKRRLTQEGKVTSPTTIISNEVKNIQLIQTEGRLTVKIDINIEGMAEVLRYYMLNYALDKRTTNEDEIMEYALNSTIQTENPHIEGPIREALEQQITPADWDRIYREVKEHEKEIEDYQRNPNAYYEVGV